MKLGYITESAHTVPWLAGASLLNGKQINIFLLKWPITNQPILLHMSKFKHRVNIPKGMLGINTNIPTTTHILSFLAS